MRISDLQPLQKVHICTHVLDRPETLMFVVHGDQGTFDVLCDAVHDEEAAMTTMNAAELLVTFPDLRTLPSLPLGTFAVQDGEDWTVRDYIYDDGDGPGDRHAPSPTGSRSLADGAYTCGCCGAEKRGIPELAHTTPEEYLTAVDDPGRDVLRMTEDLCEISAGETELFFVRGILPIAITDVGDTYCFGVWSTISAADYRRYLPTIDQDQRDLGPMAGMLANNLPGLPATLGLSLMIVPGEKGMRPWLILEQPGDPHVLYDLQSDGMTLDQLAEMIGPSLHCGSTG